MMAFSKKRISVSPIMLMNTIIQALVGADLSRPPPIYRPSLPIHIIAPYFASTELLSHKPTKRPACHPEHQRRISLPYPKRLTALPITVHPPNFRYSSAIQRYSTLKCSCIQSSPPPDTPHHEAYHRLRADTTPATARAYARM